MACKSKCKSQKLKILKKSNDNGIILCTCPNALFGTNV